MKKKASFIALCLTTLCFSSLLLADTVDTGRDIDDFDIQALRDWINTKRQISLKEIGGDLSISGQVRTEFQSNWETLKGEKVRPAQEFDVEANLMFDYRSDRSWASVKLRFDNNAGVFNGTSEKINLEKAYFGVRLAEGDTYTIALELGRRRLITVFDSKIEFLSNFDGILFRYDQAFENVGDFYIHTGPFIINEKKNQVGYVGETGLLNIGKTGLYTKYSLIDWHTKNYHKHVINDRFRFLISQLILGYRFNIGWVNDIGIVYAGALTNHLARRTDITDHKRANWGGYLGVTVGQLRKQWDWAFDAHYEVVQAQAIPDYDVIGFGIGNSNKSGFYTNKIVPLEGDGRSTPKTAGGQVNYRGFSFVLDILLSDKLDMQQSYCQAITLDDSIGPFRTYKQYEIEFIYTW